jgi:acyl-CoA synthetase (AMP-forming)/AMP-acid ligase II
MSPVDFLQRPLLWLQAITRTHTTTSSGPNFAFDLCVRKISSEEHETFDLSSWDLAFNGAEPIKPATLARFVEAFGPCRFRREAFYPWVAGWYEEEARPGRPVSAPTPPIERTVLAGVHLAPGAARPQDVIELCRSLPAWECST